jgi:hypothetical protein
VGLGPSFAADFALKAFGWGFGMTRNYGAKRVWLKNEPLPDDVLLSIAKLIRAWAEIEYIVELYLEDITSLNGSELLLLLGRMPISSKMALAAKLAKLKGKRAYKRYEEAFVPPSTAADYFSLSLKYRNVVAHGRYVGIDGEGKYCFLTKDIIEYTKGRADTEAHAFLPYTLERMALFSEGLPALLISCLKLESLHEKSTPRLLGPHPKAPKNSRKPAS